MQVCPVCQVRIDGDLVLFHVGKGDRHRLKARVCQYLNTDEKRRACINTATNLEDCSPKDFYGD